MTNEELMAAVLAEAQDILGAASTGQEERLIGNLVELLYDIALCQPEQINKKQKSAFTESMERIVYLYAYSFHRTDIMFILDKTNYAAGKEDALETLSRLAGEIVVEIIRYLKKSFNAQYISKIISAWQKDPFWKGLLPELDELK